MTNLAKMYTNKTFQAGVKKTGNSRLSEMIQNGVSTVGRTLAATLTSQHLFIHEIIRNV